jgi:phospholipid-binding lipoprotein MlaA
MAEKQYQDPYEGFNRQVYSFNEGLDKVILKPVAQGYTAVAPEPVEQGVGNFFDNLAYPTTIINQFLQGKVGDGFTGLARFGFNSTLGIAGIFDVATGMGLERQREDFGQTFAKWGFGSGPYIVVPVMGGMTLRDGIGNVAAIPTTPDYWLEDDDARLGLTVGRIIDTSASLLDERELITGDRYLFVRDTYMQRRQFQITDGAQTGDDPFLDE